MEKANIKVNNTPKKLRILNFEESQEVLGVFSNSELQQKYKLYASRSELRGITMSPHDKEFYHDNSLLKVLEDQCHLFESVFNWYKDIYDEMRETLLSKSFSTPFYIDEVSCPTQEYTLVFNDDASNPYTCSQYLDFTNLYDYPSLVFKVNESFLRSKLTQMIDIELLKAEGHIRNNDENTYQKLLNKTLVGGLDNEYFNLAGKAYKDFMEVKTYLDSQSYADSKLSLYESEYCIIRNQRFKGSFFNREDFIVDRLIITQKGVFVCTLVNCTLDNQSIHITSDNRWYKYGKEDSQEELIEFSTSPIEEVALNCVAIKQILRNKLGVEKDVPVYPVIFIANSSTLINESQHEIIKMEDLYTLIENKKTPNNLIDSLQVADVIISFEIPPVKSKFSTYNQELDSINTIYEDLYYNHLFILHKVTQLLWQFKKEDYYSSHIKRRMWTTFGFILAAIASFDYILYATLTSQRFASDYLSTALWFMLVFVFISAAKYEYQTLLSWKAGKESGQCYEVKREYFILGGFFPLLIISCLLSFVLKYIIFTIFV